MKNHLENILVSFLDYLKEGLIVIDSNKNIQYMNSYAKNLLGIKNPEGKLFSEVVKNNYLYSLISADIKKELKEEIVIDDDIFLARVLNINGMKLIHFQDITPFEIYKQAKKDFVSNVSHELKTPITVLKGVIETLENEKDPEVIKTFLKKAKNRIQQMDSLINDLLILAKLESKEEKIQKKKVKLKGIINSIFEDLKDIAEEKEVKLINKVFPDFTASVDEKKFVILMKNLIENAIKYNREGGEVKIEGKKEGDTYKISISDTGIGIPKEDIPFIFTPFYGGKNKKGMGLGLALCDKIAKLYNMEIKVHSEEGKGSTFTLIIKGDIIN